MGFTPETPARPRGTECGIRCCLATLLPNSRVYSLTGGIKDRAGGARPKQSVLKVKLNHSEIPEEGASAFSHLDSAFCLAFQPLGSLDAQPRAAYDHGAESASSLLNQVLSPYEVLPPPPWLGVRVRACAWYFAVQRLQRIKPQVSAGVTVDG